MTADSGDIQAAARIARVLLSSFQTAVLPKDAHVESVFVLPTMLPVDSEELSTQLANLPKPVTCVGFGNPAALTFGYWVVPPGVSDSFARRYPDFVRRGHTELARQWRVEDATSPVAILLEAGTALLSWRDYWTLREDYVTPYLLWSEGRPTMALAREGYVCSVRVRAYGGLWATARERKPKKRRWLRFLR